MRGGGGDDIREAHGGRGRMVKSRRMVLSTRRLTSRVRDDGECDGDLHAQGLAGWMLAVSAFVRMRRKHHLP